MNRMYVALFPSRIQASAACELVARIIDGNDSDVVTKGSTPRKNHAEENLLKDLAGQNASVQATVYSMFVTLEPCYDDKYRGHNCKEFFQGGRQFTAYYDDGTSRSIRGQFLPNPDTTHLQYTPIYILEKQLPKGQKSQLGSIRTFGDVRKNETLKFHLQVLPSDYMNEYSKQMRWEQFEKQNGGAVADASRSASGRAGGQMGSRGIGGPGDRGQQRRAKKAKTSKGKRRFFKFWRLFRK